MFSFNESACTSELLLRHPVNDLDLVAPDPHALLATTEIGPVATFVAIETVMLVAVVVIGDAPSAEVTPAGSDHV